MQGVEGDLLQDLARVRVDLDHAHVVLHAGPDVPIRELQLSYTTLVIIFGVVDVELARFLEGSSIDASYGLRAIGNVEDVLSRIKSNAFGPLDHKILLLILYIDERCACLVLVQNGELAISQLCEPFTLQAFIFHYLSMWLSSAFFMIHFCNLYHRLTNETC